MSDFMSFSEKPRLFLGNGALGIYKRTIIVYNSFKCIKSYIGIHLNNETIEQSENMHTDGSLKSRTEGASRPGLRRAAGSEELIIAEEG